MYCLENALFNSENYFPDLINFFFGGGLILHADDVNNIKLTLYCT